jgi:hypothetical protein
MQPDLAKTRRRTATMGSAVTLTALGLCASAVPANSVAPPPAGASPSAAPRAQTDPEPTVLHELAVPSVSRRTSGVSAKGSPMSAQEGAAVVAELAPTATSDYAMVGVTWAAGTSDPGTTVRVATRTGGSWSAFEELEVEEDPADVDGTTGRGGTAPMWVGEADGVAVRVVSTTGQAPDDLQVTTVEPDRTVDADSAKTSGAGAGARITGPVSYPQMPDVVTRREWGADPDLGDACWAPIYGRSVRAVVVHHTVNSNDYSRRDAPAIVRSIYAYHTQGQGWCDIGYNLLVDRFGRIYEGRRGGMRLPVRGSHAGDYNTDTVGISMIGDYDKVRPTRRLKNAMVRLVGWRLGTSYTPVYGRVRVYDRRVPHILGHRDVMSTACPGRFGYAFLPALRERVRDYLSEYDSRIKARAADLGRRTTGRIFVGEAATHGGYVTTFERGKMAFKPGLGAHWLSGRILGAYESFGGVRGRLGFPRGDAQPIGATGVTRMLFEHGRLYKTGAQRPRMLFGRVLRRWIKTDGVTGSLGAPTSSVSSTSARETAAFQHGRITWFKADNRIVVERS